MSCILSWQFLQVVSARVNTTCGYQRTTFQSQHTITRWAPVAGLQRQYSSQIQKISGFRSRASWTEASPTAAMPLFCPPRLTELGWPKSPQSRLDPSEPSLRQQFADMLRAVAEIGVDLSTPPDPTGDLSAEDADSPSPLVAGRAMPHIVS